MKQRKKDESKAVVDFYMSATQRTKRNKLIGEAMIVATSALSDFQWEDAIAIAIATNGMKRDAFKHSPRHITPDRSGLLQGQGEMLTHTHGSW